MGPFKYWRNFLLCKKSHDFHIKIFAQGQCSRMEFWLGGLCYKTVLPGIARNARNSTNISDLMYFINFLFFWEGGKKFTSKSFFYKLHVRIWGLGLASSFLKFSSFRELKKVTNELILTIFCNFCVMFEKNCKFIVS